MRSCNLPPAGLLSRSGLILAAAMIGTALPAWSLHHHASSELVYQEDYEGETDYPTTPEVNEILGSGLVGDSLSGPGGAPTLAGGVARASVSASGSFAQGVWLPASDFGKGPIGVSGDFSELNVSDDSAGSAIVEATFEATGGDIFVHAYAGAGRNGSGTLTDGFLGIRTGPAAGGPTTNLQIPLPAAETAALGGGAEFALHLGVDRDQALAEAVLEITGFSPLVVGPLAIDSGAAGLGVEQMTQAFVLEDGGVSAPLELEFDALEIYRLYSTSFVVDTTADEVDALIGDDLCQTASGFCSLRAAIQESNAAFGFGEIVLPSGDYALSIAGAEEDAAATGDLDILDDLVIRGGGRESTVVDGADLDRVFHLPLTGTPFMARLTDLEITNGAALTAGGHTGGGIETYARLDLARCIVSNNRANLAGGIMNRSELNLEGCVVRGNEAQNVGFTNTKAGGIASPSTSAPGLSPTSAVILDSAIIDNIAPNTGGLELGGGDSIIVRNTTISGNSGTQVNTFNSNVFLRQVTIFGDFGTGLSAGSFSGTNTLEISNSAIEGTPACNLSTTAPVVATYYGHNASSDTSCGFSGPGDVEGVALGLWPLAPLDDTMAHLPQSGSPLVDTADETECSSRDQRGVGRPIDGDESGSAECDLGAIELPEPGFGLLLASGVLWLRSCLIRRRRPAPLRDSSP